MECELLERGRTTIGKSRSATTMSDSAVARPVAPRTGRPLPVDISTIDLGIVHCERRTVYGADAQPVTRLHSPEGVFLYARKLQKALMGTVWLASLCGPGPYFIRTDTLVAVKELRKDCIDAGKTVDGLAVREDPKREVRVMRYLNDATYIDCPGYHSVSKLLHVLADDTYLYLVLEYHAGGDTFSLLKSLDDDRLPEHAVRNYFARLVDGVSYMHSGGLVHLDISTENVMLSSVESLIPKLIDFGTTGCMPSLSGLPMGPGFVGKKQYAAPEVMANVVYSGVKADVWSLGVMLFMLLFGAPPFESATKACKVYSAIVRHGLPTLLHHWGLDGTVSAHALDLVLKLLTIDPEHRPTLTEIQAHPWFTAV